MVKFSKNICIEQSNPSYKQVGKVKRNNRQLTRLFQVNPLIFIEVIRPFKEIIVCIRHEKLV